MIKFLVLPLITIGSFAQTAPVNFNDFYPIDRGHSYVEFSVKYMGFAKVKGRFADFSGLVRYDGKNIESISVSLSIDATSIDSDHEMRDDDLKSPNWFDANAFPAITFSSKAARETASGFEVVGDLTMKGITKEVVLIMDPPSGVLKDARADHQVIFTGATTIDRTEFGVEGKNWSGVKEGVAGVESDVAITFSILGKQIKETNFRNWVRNEERPQGQVYKAIKAEGLQKGLDIFKQLRASSEGSLTMNALSIVGNMLKLEGSLKDAVAVYEANRDAFPDDPEVYYELGMAYGASGDLGKARTALSEALKKNPAHIKSAEILRHL